MLKTNSKTHFIVCIAILGALSGVLMLLEFPLPIAPPFYKVDLSDVAALIGGFGLGPMAEHSSLSQVLSIKRNMIRRVLLFHYYVV